jgi:hypothetical protein
MDAGKRKLVKIEQAVKKINRLDDCGRRRSGAKRAAEKGMILGEDNPQG